MPRLTDPGGPLFTFEDGKVILASESKAATPGKASGTSGAVAARSGPPDERMPPGVTQAAIDASNAANPEAAGANGTNFTGDVRDGSGGDTSGQSGPAADYSTFLGIYGLPPDVQAKVTQIFANTPDVSQATALALAYIRGTDWYAKTYPGIQEGIARGVIGNEADYRAYLNNANQLYQRYYGRSATGEDIRAALSGGTSLATLEKQFAGDAYIKANTGDIQYALGAFGDTGQANPEDLKALGQEQVGLDSTQGQIVQAAYSKALQRLHGAFQGVLANPNLNLGPNGLSAPSLAGTNTQPDIGA